MRLTDIKSTLKDGTPGTFFKIILEFKGKFPMDIIGTCSPLGIVTGGKVVFLLLSTSKFGDEVMWSVAPLSIINLWRRNNVCDRPHEAPATLTLGLVDCVVPLPCMIDKICWICKSDSPFVTDGTSCIIGPSLTLLTED